MRLSDLPLLALQQPHCFPPGTTCPHCGRSFSDAQGVAYLSAGAVMELDGTRTRRAHSSPEAFFNIGYHGSDIEVRDSVDAEIVDDLASGQFTICFCSLECLQAAFNELIDELRAALALKRKAIADSGEA